MRGRKIDWEKAELAFIEGASYQEIADQYGISINTVYGAGMRYEWTKKKKEFQEHTRKTALAVKAASRAEMLLSFDDDVLKMTRVILNRCAGLIRSKADGVSAYDLSSVMNTIRNAQHVGRLALGATTSNNGVSAPSGGPVQFSEVKDLDELTDEQLLKIINGQQ